MYLVIELPECADIGSDADEARLEIDLVDAEEFEVWLNETLNEMKRGMNRTLVRKVAAAKVERPRNGVCRKCGRVHRKGSQIYKDHSK